MDKKVIDIEIRELDIELIKPNTDNFKNPKQGGTKVVIIGKPGCFLKGTEVLMSDGEIKNIEDIRVGQDLMGDDSTPRKVLSLCRGNEQMYRICIETGEVITVNENHILSLKSKYTGQIIDIELYKYIEKDLKFKREFLWFRNPVEFKEISKDSIYYNVIGTKDKRERLLERYIESFFRMESFYFYSCKISQTVSYEFLRQVLFLARSLGKKGYIKNETCYISAPDFFYYNYHSVFEFSIIKDSIDDYYGFEISGNRRFLLEDCSVVHNTGKSTIISSILYAKKHIFPCGFAISGTEDSNGFYQQFFPSTFIYEEYKDDTVENFIKRQKIARKYVKNPWALAIIDDATDNPAVFTKPVQQGMFKNGRHWKMLYLLGLQYCFDIRPNIRTSIDITFILREPALTVREKLWKNFASIIPDFDMFCQIMDQLTDNYTALVILNNVQANDFTDCVFYYKAKIPPEDFKIGCQEYWDIHFDRMKESTKIQ